MEDTPAYIPLIHKIQVEGERVYREYCYRHGTPPKSDQCFVYLGWRQKVTMQRESHLFAQFSPRNTSGDYQPTLDGFKVFYVAVEDHLEIFIKPSPDSQL